MPGVREEGETGVQTQKNSDNWVNKQTRRRHRTTDEQTNNETDVLKSEQLRC